MEIRTTYNKFYIYASSVRKQKGSAYLIFFDTSVVIVYISKENYKAVKKDAALKAKAESLPFLGKIKYKNAYINDYWDEFASKLLNMSVRDIIKSHDDSLEIRYDAIDKITCSAVFENTGEYGETENDGMIQIKFGKSKIVFFHRYREEDDQYIRLKELVNSIKGK